MIRKLLCKLGHHRGGELKISFHTVPSEEDCARLIATREWPADEWRTCEVCSTRMFIRKVYLPS